MNITSVTIEDGSSRPAAGRWPVESPVETPPLRFFREVVCLRFETGGAADGIRVDAEAITLRAAFLPYDYDALDPGDPALEASVAESGGTVKVTLDAPRQVSWVRLASTVALGSSLGFYRLDGETLADNPTLTTTVEGVETGVARFTEAVEAEPVRGILAAPAFAVSGPVNLQAATRVTSVRAATLPAGVDFTDGRFGLRLTGPSLRVGDLTGLHIRSYPTGARLGLSAPEDPGSAVFFWRTDGEVGKTVPADNGAVDAGRELAGALKRYLNDFFARLSADPEGPPPAPPQFVDVALVVESDSPCVLDITDFDLPYHLVRQSFPSREEKLVLRFAGDEATVGEVSVQLPGNATVRSASLSTVESFGGDHPVSSGDDDPAGALQAQKEGVHVSAGRWVAQPIAPFEATAVSGVALALMATSTGAELLVEVREDWFGQPAGKKLAAGTVTLGKAGQRRWVTLLFPEAAVLSSSSHWLLATAAARDAVWLGDSGDTSVRSFENPDGSSVGPELRTFEGLQAAYRLLSRGRQAREQPQASLSVGKLGVEGTNAEGGRRVYDLTSAVGEYLESVVPDGSTSAVPLYLTSGLRGLITVDPPLVEYDLE